MLTVEIEGRTREAQVAVGFCCECNGFDDNTDCCVVVDVVLSRMVLLVVSMMILCVLSLLLSSSLLYIDISIVR